MPKFKKADPPPALVDPIAEAIEAALSAVTLVNEKNAEMRARHDALTRERKNVAAARSSKVEILSQIDKLVDEAAAKFVERYSSSFAAALGGGEELQSGTDRIRIRHPALPRWGASGPVDIEDIPGLMPELYRARLRAIVEGGNLKYGLPKAERVKRLAAIDAELASIETGHTSLVESAAELGIKFDLLPTVVKQREREEAIANQDMRAVVPRSAGFGAVAE